MSNLFSDQFPEFTTSEALEKVKQEYVSRGYDEYYVVTGSIKDRREKFERLWAIYERYCDRFFLDQVKQDFSGRTWEMYLGVMFLTNGFTITSHDHGPDIKITSTRVPTWVEAVAVKRGDGPDAVPDLELHSGVIGDVPHDQMLLRLTQALEEKARKYQKYVSEKILGATDPFIIAINRGLLGLPDPEMPLVWKALFALGHLTLTIPLGGSYNEASSFISRRETVQKKSGSIVALGFFEREENKGISAILDSNTTVLNHPEKIGTDCHLIHNPLATAPLNPRRFSFLEQWKLQGSEIIKIKR